jgi:CYTH domain-containing protein
VESAWITIKGKGAIVRPEYEYEIPVGDAKALLRMCTFSLEKVRYEIRYEGCVWEVDEFSGPHKGLWLAELELESVSEKFPLPPWAGEEVSDDPRYTNAAMAEAGKAP